MPVALKANRGKVVFIHGDRLYWRFRRTFKCFCRLSVLVLLLSLQQPTLLFAQDKEITNGLGMTFVLVPAGMFIMGSPVEESFRDISEVHHQVTLSQPFYMQTTEVTVDQWRAVMGTRWFAKKKGTGEMPVVKVSWHDCDKYIQKLNRMTGEQYTLPTEAQWEYAARAGSQDAYFWGNQIACTNAMYANNPKKHDGCVGTNQSTGLPPGQPAPVKRFAPNPWGLYDMHGNVWEWCLDRFDHYQTVSVIDPCETKRGKDRVRRGGSWLSPGYSLRSANRAFAHPMSRFKNTGFRLVKPLPE